MGYAGGARPNPTYYQIGDHSETVQVDFDPTRVSYQQLLTAFWNGHDATEDPYTRQYRSAIFYSNEEQRKLAEGSKAEQQSKAKGKLLTSIEPLNKFYAAEDYHQKFYLQQYDDIVAEINAIYPEAQDRMNSTAAARLNGYLGGFGDPGVLQKELGSLGLSEAGQQALLKATEMGLAQTCPSGITIN